MVAVHRRVGEGQQGRRVLEQAADVVAGVVGQARVADLVVEEGRAVLPQGLVAVHARAVVTEDRLRHERDGLALGARDVLDDVLVEQQVVGRLQQRVEAEVDLGLAAVPTSWCCISTWMPDAMSWDTISERRSV